MRLGPIVLYEYYREHYRLHAEIVYGSNKKAFQGLMIMGRAAGGVSEIVEKAIHDSLREC